MNDKDIDYCSFVSKITQKDDYYIGYIINENISEEFPAEVKNDIRKKNEICRGYFFVNKNTEEAKVQIKDTKKEIRDLNKQIKKISKEKERQLKKMMHLSRISIFDKIGFISKAKTNNLINKLNQLENKQIINGFVYQNSIPLAYIEGQGFVELKNSDFKTTFIVLR